MTNVGVPLSRAGFGSLSPDGCTVPLNSDSLHDLASPIHQVRAMTELILKKYQGKLDDDAETMFRFLENSTERLENLLAGMKTYMRMVGTPRPYQRCDGGAVFNSALASISQAIEQSTAEITQEQLPELYCDPSRICCAFTNLLDNAIKFRGEQMPKVYVSATRRENFWVFSIRDNGIGIDPRYSERIFSVFKRLNPGAYPGAGVGLAITRQIIEQHGGRIWVESKLGSGATFYFTLPGGESA